MQVKKAGRVKWYDPAKRHGYIEPDDGGPDICLRSVVLSKDGLQLPGAGNPIECLAECDARGVWTAMHVLSLDTSAVARPDMKPRVAAETDWMPGRVKWLCPTHGYGFVVCPPPWGDAFFHAEDLKRCGIAGVTGDQRVLVKCGRSRRGAAVADMRLV